MIVTFRRAREGAYTAAEHTGVVLCAMYWHALDAIWLVLYGTLAACSW
jgi:nitric oxide reductase NorE protein